MKPTIGIVHATRNAMEPMNDIFAARLGLDATILNFLDEAMLVLMQRKGAAAPDVVHRMQNILISAQEAGASVIVASCTSLAEAIERARIQVNIPVIRVDVPLAVEVVSRFQRVAVLASAQSAIEPFRTLLETKASAYGKKVEPSFHYCPGAFAALSSGNCAEHDRIVLDEISTVMKEGPEAILLPQPSLARVIRQIPSDLDVKVLSSVEAVVNQIAVTLRKKEL
jgi:aspartate/glutamate racemase